MKIHSVFLAANNASSNVQMIYFKNLLVHLTTTVCFWIGNITFFDYCMSLQHFFHQKIVQLHQELFGFQFFFSPSNQTIRGSLKEHSAIKLFTSTYTLLLQWKLGLVSFDRSNLVLYNKNHKWTTQPKSVIKCK